LWNYGVGLSSSAGAQNFVLTNPTRAGRLQRLACLSGASYTLEFKNSLAGTTWNPVQTVAGAGNQITLSDCSATGT